MRNTAVTAAYLVPGFISGQTGFADYLAKMRRTAGHYRLINSCAMLGIIEELPEMLL